MQLDAQMGNDIQITATTLSRNGSQGALLLVPGAGASLGNTPGSDARLFGTTILGQTAASTAGLDLLSNANAGSGAGIVSPIILRANSAADMTADFVTYDPTVGFVNASPLAPLTNTFVGSGTSSVIALTAATAAPAGITDLFALKTTSNITASGANSTLRIRSILGSQTDIGGLVLNGVGASAPVVSANLLFGDVAARDTTVSNATLFREGVVYVAVVTPPESQPFLATWRPQTSRSLETACSGSRGPTRLKEPSP